MPPREDLDQLEEVIKSIRGKLEQLQTLDGHQLDALMQFIQQPCPTPLQKELMHNAQWLYAIVEARMMRDFKEARRQGELKPDDEPDIIDILAETAKYSRDLWLQVRDMDFNADDDDDSPDPDGGEPVEVISPAHYTRRRAS